MLLSGCVHKPLHQAHQLLALVLWDPVFGVEKPPPDLLEHVEDAQKLCCCRPDGSQRLPFCIAVVRDERRRLPASTESSITDGLLEKPETCRRK